MTGTSPTPDPAEFTAKERAQFEQPASEAEAGHSADFLQVTSPLRAGGDSTP